MSNLRAIANAPAVWNRSCATCSKHRSSGADRLDSKSRIKLPRVPTRLSRARSVVRTAGRGANAPFPQRTLTTSASLTPDNSCAESGDSATVTGRVDVPVPVVSFSPEPRAVLGVIQIATDLVMDVEGSLLIHQLPGVEVRYAKIAFDQEEICAETYEQALETGAIGSAAKSIGLPADYITTWGLSCTSMSFILGSQALEGAIAPYAAAADGQMVLTDMWQGVVSSLNALAPHHGKRVGVLLPYIPEVADKNLQLLVDEGFEVASAMSLGLTVDKETSAVTQECITECVKQIAAQGAPDLIFIGCSAFRACTPGFISTLEKTTGLPVVTSTQAFLWHMLRLAGINDTLEGYGELFSEH